MADELKRRLIDDCKIMGRGLKRNGTESRVKDLGCQRFLFISIEGIDEPRSGSPVRSDAVPVPERPAQVYT